MKKFLVVIIGLISIVLIINKVFKIYHLHNLLGSEAVVNFYFNVPEEHIDSYFDLPKGTYDKNKHTIICSFQERNSYGSGSFYNLPTFTYSDGINCNDSFSIEKHRRFSLTEIQNDNKLYIRIINKNHPYILHKDYSSSLAFRKKEMTFRLGKINNFIIEFNSIEEYCK